MDTNGEVDDRGIGHRERILSFRRQILSLIDEYETIELRNYRLQHATCSGCGQKSCSRLAEFSSADWLIQERTDELPLERLYGDVVPAITILEELQGSSATRSLEEVLLSSATNVVANGNADRGGHIFSLDEVCILPEDSEAAPKQRENLQSTSTMADAGDDMSVHLSEAVTENDSIRRPMVDPIAKITRPEDEDGTSLFTAPNSKGTSSAGTNRHASYQSESSAAATRQAKMKTSGRTRFFAQNGSIVSALPSFQMSSSKIRRLIGSIVVSAKFESIISGVIVMNAVYMGWATNYVMEDTRHEETKGMHVVSLCFCIAYAIELTMRITTYGPAFCKLPERNWNIFDSLLVLQSTSEQAMYWGNFSENGVGGGLTFLRVFRLGKLVKMLRIVRLMRSMREMRLILFSIMGSLKSMFWSFCLIVVCLYMFSLVFVQACIDSLKDDLASTQTRQEIALYWSSVETGMLTLFEAATGGDDWTRMSSPLKAIGSAYYAGFCLYIAFFLFVLMNTITSLFVESTFQTASQDHQYTIQSVLDKKALYVRSLEILFNEADEDLDGYISEHEIANIMDDPRMRAFAESLNIEISDTQRFFDLLTEHGTRHLDVDTFVDACCRMKGQALSIDVQDILMRLKKAHEHRNDFFEDVNTKLKVQDDMIATLSANMDMFGK